MQLGITHRDRSRRASTVATLMVVLAMGVPARAQPYPAGGPYRPVERPRPFGQGTVNAGGALAFGSYGDGFAFTLGANLGYFVLDGLEPGIYSDVTFGSEINTEISVLPYLRYLLYRSYSLSPYLKVQGGGLFVIDGPKLGVIGGGGGVIIGLGRGLAFNIEGLVLKLLPESDCGEGDNCIRYQMGFSISFLFGGARAPAPRHAPPPPPPPSEPPMAPGDAPPAGVPQEAPAGGPPAAPPEEPGMG
jgi:hypothetical protein